jgi:putative solute:sodium symporter small subunit
MAAMRCGWPAIRERADGIGAGREERMSGKSTVTDPKGYWKANIRLTVGLLVIWFTASYGCGILLRDFLDQFRVGGAPMGLWFAQQGSIYVFLALIVYYCFAMKRIEARFSRGDATTVPKQQG